MKSKWTLACSIIDGMSLRERAMIFAAAAFVLIAAIKVGLIDPLASRQKIAAEQLQQQQQQITEMQTSMQTMARNMRNDEQSPAHARIAALKSTLLENEGYLQELSQRMVAPDKMAGVLQQVLKHNDQLQLVAFKTLEPALLDESSAGKVPADPQARIIYKHGVQITVRGNYLELMRYLAALENLPTQMLWGEVNMKVEKHPDSVMTLTVYTLSMDKIWLAV